MSASLLQVRDLNKEFIVRKNLFSRRQVIRAVDGVSFDVLAGETLGLVGESGSGKSTTAHMILRLLAPSGGSVTFRGTDLSSVSEINLRKLRRDLQIIFQSASSVLDPAMTAGELLSTPLRIHHVVPEMQVSAEVGRIMELVGLSEEECSKYPDQLSGGQYQRIIIARAIATRPALIVCDEPVSALDVSVQGQILNLLASLKRELGLTYLFISHDLAVIRHICDRVAVMHAGRIVETGTTEDILDSPGHEYTRRLVTELHK